MSWWESSYVVCSYIMGLILNTVVDVSRDS